MVAIFFELLISTKNIQVSTNLTVIFGLIVNEIATNAFKYGFQDAGKAVFRVEMSTEDSTNCYVLTLSNSGRSLSEGKDLENPYSLGLQLISFLEDQLDDEIDLTSPTRCLLSVFRDNAEVIAAGDEVK